jgi:hypothetical protein
MLTSLELLVSNMTVADLAQHTGVSVEEIVALAVRRPRATTPAASPPARAKPAPAARGVRKGGNTAGTTARGKAGNKYERAAAYTAKVADVVRSARGPISSADIRAKIGGNVTRARLALQRLIADGVVTHDGGTTSARRYSAAR